MWRYSRIRTCLVLLAVLVTRDSNKNAWHSEEIFEALQFSCVALGHWIQASFEGLGRVSLFLLSSLCSLTGVADASAMFSLTKTCVDCLLQFGNLFIQCFLYTQVTQVYSFYCIRWPFSLERLRAQMSLFFDRWITFIWLRPEATMGDFSLRIDGPVWFLEISGCWQWLLHWHIIGRAQVGASFPLDCSSALLDIVKTSVPQWWSSAKARWISFEVVSLASAWHLGWKSRDFSNPNGVFWGFPRLLFLGNFYHVLVEVEMPTEPLRSWSLKKQTFAPVAWCRPMQGFLSNMMASVAWWLERWGATLWLRSCNGL